MFVCICNQINLKDIAELKKAQPELSFEEAMSVLEFAGDCGTCVASKELIQKRWEKDLTQTENKENSEICVVNV